MKRAVGWFVLLPLGLVLVVFALANRQAVSIGIDPIAPENPFIQPLGMPVFVLVYVTLIAGVLIGGIAVWFSQGRHRSAERKLRQEAEAARAEASQLRREKRAGEALALLEDAESR